MRLINVDALIEIFDKDKYYRIKNEYQSGYNDGMLHAEVVADNQPTIDAVPVRHGKWLPIIEANENGEPYQAGVYCSECGETDVYCPNYCPNCGARMDEE